MVISKHLVSDQEFYLLFIGQFSFCLLFIGQYLSSTCTGMQTEMGLIIEPVERQVFQSCNS